MWVADAAGQRRFYDDILYPLMERAKKGEVALIFLDAAHFVMGYDFLGYIYGRQRRFIRTWSGRKRYNAGQQHLLLGRKKDFKKRLRFKSSFEHHAFFAHPPILSLGDKVKSNFTKNIHIKWRMILSCP